MAAKPPIRMTRFEIALLALLLICAMTSWLFFERWVDLAYKGQEPREDRLQLAENVPLRQVELTTTQERLTALRGKLNELNAEHARAAAAAQTLVLTHPGLGSLPADFLATRIETWQAYAVARTDLDAAERLVRRLEIELEALTERRLTLGAELAALKPEDKGYRAAEARLAASQEQGTAAQKKLAEQRLEPARLKARIEALLAASPPLTQFSPTTAQLLNLPADVLPAFTSATTKRDEAARTAAALGQQIDAEKATLTAGTEALLNAQRDAEEKLLLGRERWAWWKRGVTALCAMGLMAVLGVVVGLLTLLPLVHKKLGSGDAPFFAARAPLFLAGVITVLGLFAFQLAPALAAVLGVFLLIVVAGAVRAPKGGGGVK